MPGARSQLVLLVLGASTAAGEEFFLAEEKSCVRADRRREGCTRKKPRSWCNKPKKACNFMTPNNKCGTANCQKNCDYLCDLCDDPP